MSGTPDFSNHLFKRKNDHRAWLRIIVLVFWVAIVAFQISNHVLWRDEVRALSIALNGDNLIAMLDGLRGEGHPALWYIMLRLTYDLVGRVEVLQGLAFLAAILAVAMLIWRSPFPLALIIIILTGHLFLSEYAVIARNYGISALLLFAIADRYATHRARGYVLGSLLFLLANTNVIAALIVCAFLLFWWLDVISETGLRWSAQLSTLLLNAIVATAGLAICAITILPTYNDAAVIDMPAESLAEAALGAVVHPGGTSLGSLFGYLVPVAGSLILFISTLGLIGRLSAFVAAIVSLIACALILETAARGDYRHAAVWLSFLIALYWISWKDVAQPFPGWRGWLTLLGRLAFVLLLGVQSIKSGKELARLTDAPRSRSADFARLIESRPDLANAVILAEPEYMAEALPYYLSNSIYHIREHRYAVVSRFSRSGQLDTDLGETLRVGRSLRERSGKPVVIVLAHRLEKMQPGQVVREGYNWTFRASAEQIWEFSEATTLLRRMGPARTDETYDVYLLK